MSDVATVETPVAGALPNVAALDQEALRREADAILHEVNAGTAGQAPSPAPGGSPVATVSVFDEAATRAGIGLIVESADDAVAAYFAGAAREAGGSEAICQKFSSLSRLNPALKNPLTDGLVEFCRERNWNIDKKSVVVVILVAWAKNIASARSGVAELRQLNKPEPVTTAPVAASA